jgi:hypothetical protein
MSNTTIRIVGLSLQGFERLFSGEVGILACGPGIKSITT